MKPVFLLVALLSIVIPSQYAGAESLGQIPGAPVHLGGGFSLLYPERNFPVCIKASVECQAEKKGSIACLGGQGNTDNSITFAPRTTFSVREITSKYDYFRELNINASVSGSYGVFSGSASYSYHSIDDITEDSVSWAITAKSDYGSYKLANPEVKEPYKSLAPVKLIDSCGPQYVSEVDRGVLASVLYTFHTRNEAKLREVKASLAAGVSGGAFSLGGAASINDFMTSLSAYGSISINVFTIGGEGTTALQALVKENPMELQKVKDALAAYVANQSEDRSAVLGFRTSSIGKLIGKPEIDPDYSSYLVALERINEYRLRLVDFGRGLDRILLNQADFSADPNNLVSLSEKLDCELELVELTASNCRLWTQVLTSALTNGDPTDDDLARLAMTYGIYKDNDFAKQIGGRTMSMISDDEGDGSDSSSPRSCASLKKSTFMLANKISAAAISKKDDVRGLIDTDGSPACSHTPDAKLLSELSDVPEFPFGFNYYFDSFETTPLPSTGQDRFYGQLTGATKVTYVEAYYRDSAMVRRLLRHVGNTDASESFGFTFEIKPELKNKFVELVIHTKRGGSYSIQVQVPEA